MRRITTWLLLVALALGVRPAVAQVAPPPGVKVKIAGTTVGQAYKLNFASGATAVDAGNGQVDVTISGGGGGGITSLNGDATAAQTVNVGSSGTDFAIANAGATHTLNLPTADATHTGKLAAADWSTFNAKPSDASVVHKATNETVTGNKIFKPSADGIPLEIQDAAGASLVQFNTVIPQLLVDNFQIITATHLSLLGAGAIDIGDGTQLVTATGDSFTVTTVTQDITMSSGVNFNLNSAGDTTITPGGSLIVNASGTSIVGGGHTIAEESNILLYTSGSTPPSFFTPNHIGMRASAGVSIDSISGISIGSGTTATLTGSTVQLDTGASANIVLDTAGDSATMGGNTVQISGGDSLQAAANNGVRMTLNGSGGSAELANDTDATSVVLSGGGITVTGRIFTTITGSTISVSGGDITLDPSGGGSLFAGTAGNKLSFFGVGAASQQSVASLTNSVTAGGTDDTIANYTSLVVYATDAAAIRNDIYQLTRKVAQLQAALATYGLVN